MENGQKDQVNVENLALDFTVPGYDMELRVGLLWPFPTEVSDHFTEAWWPRVPSHFGEHR
jgi:hypothetical protein